MMVKAFADIIEYFSARLLGARTCFFPRPPANAEVLSGGFDIFAEIPVDGLAFDLKFDETLDIEIELPEFMAPNEPTTP